MLPLYLRPLAVLRKTKPQITATPAVRGKPGFEFLPLKHLRTLPNFENLFPEKFQLKQVSNAIRWVIIRPNYETFDIYR